MSNQYYNLNYSPIAQGFDAETWRTLFGNVAVINGKLQFTQAAIIHYGDILRGDASFSVNIAPLSDGDTKFGFIQYNKNEYAYFQISGPNLTAETSDGVTAYSVSIPWQTEWSGVDTVFRIKWEAGAVRFYVNNNLMETIGSSSTLNIPTSEVPNDPMSLYLYSDSVDLFLLNYISVVGIQSFLMSTGNNDSIFEPFITESDRISISEAVTVVPATIMAVNKVDSVILTENNKQTIDYKHPSGLISTLSITEGVTVGSPA